MAGGRDKLEREGERTRVEKKFPSDRGERLVCRVAIGGCRERGGRGGGGRYVSVQEEGTYTWCVRKVSLVG